MPQWLKMIMCLAIGWWLGFFVAGMVIRPEVHKVAFRQGIDRGWIEAMEFAIMHGAAKWEEPLCDLFFQAAGECAWFVQAVKENKSVGAPLRRILESLFVLR